MQHKPEVKVFDNKLMHSFLQCHSNEMTILIVEGKKSLVHMVLSDPKIL